MTKEETLKILAHLSAFYGQGKSNVKMMVEAWHEIIGVYDYHIARRAVVDSASHDKREYASFPTAGVIVETIKRQNGLYNRVYNEALKSAGDYSGLSDDAKKIISEKQYDAFMALPYEQRLDYRDAFIEMIKGNDLQIEQRRHQLEQKV